MGLFEHWPYVNFHDMNLDWIIKKIKNVETAEANTAEYAEAAAESAAASQLSADAALASQEAAHQSEVNASEDAAALAGKALQVDVNTARIDNILVQGTQTEGNAELIDIRVGANGTTYPLAGDAVRGQVQNIENILDKMAEVTDIGSAVWEQGTINNNGIVTDSTTRCRSKSLVGYDSAAYIRIIIATGYEVSIMEYSDQKAVSSNFVQRLVSFTPNRIEFIPVTGHMYRMLIKYPDNSEITPSDIADNAVHCWAYSAKTVDNDGITFAVDNLQILAENGDNELIDWEQGSLNVNTGEPIAAANRVRSKYYATYNSLRYIYFSCPDDWMLGVRSYEQSDTATLIQSYPFKGGYYLIPHTEGTMYKFILRRYDNENITPADVPSEVRIIPVFNTYWSRDAHGESVATRTTKRNNPTYVSQILSVAQSYYDHRNDQTGSVYDMVYGSNSALRQDTYTNEIDCSTFVGLLLRGVPYTDTQYYTHVNTPAASVVANPEYVWSLNPQYYDYYSADMTTEPTDATRASQIAEWMIDMGWRVPKDKKLLNLEPGDIIFYSRLTADGSAIAQPDRFMSINHTAICISKEPTVPGDGYYEGGFKYKHRLMEVAHHTPCVGTRVVENGWQTPDVVNTNNYNTISVICRPDLGSI